MYLKSLIFGFNRIIGGGRSMSPKFVKLLEDQLHLDFYRQTGLNLINNAEKITLIFYHLDYLYGYKNNEYRLSVQLKIIYLGMNVTIKWKNMSEDIMNNLTPSPFDDDFDASQIKIWFDDLNVDSILREYNTKPDPSEWGFDIHAFPFDIDVDHFSADGMYLIIEMKEPDEEEANKLVVNLYDFIDSWNEKSKKNDRCDGLVHNSEAEIIEADYIKFYMDYGSASELALNGMLEIMEATNNIKKVTITSYPDKRTKLNII